MDNAKKIIEKEFSTVGTIEYNEYGDYGEYYINFRLNNSVKRIQLGEIDIYSPHGSVVTSVEPFFDEHKLIKINSLYYANRNKFLMFANVTGKYVFDIDNPDKSHIEIKNVSCIDISDVSIHYSKSYTGIVTSFERQEDFIVVTLNTTDIKFKCPINSIKAIDLTKQINISVDVYMEPDSPQTSDNYTVTEVNQM